MKKPFYDAIAARWDEATGDEGGPYKRLVLNAALDARLPPLAGKRLLEIGAGTGYFSRWLCSKRRERPACWILADLSPGLLRIAARRSGHPRVRLDAAAPWPFPAASFDVVLAVMILNELPGRAVRRFLAEAARVLAPGGVLVAATLHPAFLKALSRKDVLRREGGVATMPGPAGLRLPVLAREGDELEWLLGQAGFAFERDEIAATPEFVREKPDLRFPPSMPRAVVLAARRS